MSNSGISGYNIPTSHAHDSEPDYYVSDIVLCAVFYFIPLIKSEFVYASKG